MAKPYNIIITNGSGNANVFNDEYTVEANVNGYNNTTIDPSSLTVVEGTDNYDLLISAEGTLTLHVTETGLTDGTPIVGATFVRCDSAGVEYGEVITTNDSGIATFANVPYDENNAPLIYFKQKASDGDHTYEQNTQNTSLSESTKTIEIINAQPALRTFTLKDKNYNGLPIDSGSITLK